MQKSLLFLFAAVLLVTPVLTQAQEETSLEAIEPSVSVPDQFFRGRVIEIVDEGENEAGGYTSFFQEVKVELQSGAEKGQSINIRDEGVAGLTRSQRLQLGDELVIGKFDNAGELQYYVADRFRLPVSAAILGLFFVAAVVFGSWRGLRSVLGLAVSILILALFIVPQMLEGRDPILITVIGTACIALLSIFLSHGFHRRTAIAFSSTIGILGLAAALAYAFVIWGKLFGLGSEEAFYVQVFPGADINLRGLLLSGIIIGTLGVLDDVTTSQAAAVEEISLANPQLGVKELYSRGLRVGREHIAALVNTLALAYAGASLPLFLLFSLADAQPLWVVLNSELVSEEVIRTLVGSLALILAVPLTTYLAARFLKKKEPEPVL